MKKNSREDFVVFETFETLDAGGDTVPALVPEHVRVEFYVKSLFKSVLCERKGNRFFNCRLASDGHALECAIPQFVKGGLGLGLLKHRVTIVFDNDVFPASEQYVPVPELVTLEDGSHIELVEGPGDFDEDNPIWSRPIILVPGESSGHAVLYTEQDLTEEEKAQARANIGVTEFFDATHPVTTFAEVQAAIAAGKHVRLIVTDMGTTREIPLVYYNEDEAFFGVYQGTDRVIGYYLDANGWMTDPVILQAAINDLSTIRSGAANNVKYTQQSLTSGQKAQARSNIDAVSKAESITYAALVALRKEGTLVPGQYYRITDYVTTTADTESRAMGHQFDVIVLALDGTHLSEEAFAAHHSGDTYFANSKLDAWKIWYCLDNDTTRFAWADTTNGKGVIYRMIDEWQNDVPYDFKNIQFKRYKVTAKTAYASALSFLDGLYIGLPGSASMGFDIDSSDYKWYYTFSKLGDDWATDAVDDSVVGGHPYDNSYGETRNGNDVAILNNIVNANGVVVGAFRQAIDPTVVNSNGYSTTEVSIRNRFGRAGNIMHLGGPFAYNSCDRDYYNNIIIGCNRYSVIGAGFRQNTIFTNNDCGFNAFASLFIRNILVSKHAIIDNSFGAECSDNVIAIKNSFICNSVGHRFESNTIASALDAYDGIGYLNIGSYCHDNTVTITGTQGLCYSSIASAFANNTITGFFRECTFGDNCQYLTVNGELRRCEFPNYSRHLTVNGVVRYLRILGEVSYCNFNGPIRNANVYGSLKYVTIPAGTDQTQFVMCDIRGDIEGASDSSHAILDAAQFRAADYVGRQRIAIEAGASGVIVASWWDANGKRVGIKSTDGGTTWAAYDIVPSIDQTYDGTSANAQSGVAMAGALAGKQDNISDLIPAQASDQNQLADKAFVNSSIGTATATFRGTYNLVSDLSLTTSATREQVATALASEIATADNNDYCFVQIPTADATPSEIARVDRYKFDGTAWAYEWSLNNSSFTASQWAAINSGITAALVTTFGNKYDKPSGGIPSSDMASAVQTSLGKADTAYQKPTNGIPASDMEAGAIPDAVEANPTVPAGTTPTDLAGLKVGSNYYGLSNKEDKSNKVISLSSQSTDTEYPSAKCVYDLIGDVETLINAL